MARQAEGMGRQSSRGTAGRGVTAPGLRGGRRSVLSALKRLGGASVPRLAGTVRLNIETVRAHLKALAAAGLVTRQGTRRRGPGRPEVLYALTPAAESLFPRREAEVLRDLALFLKDTGRHDLLEEFFERLIARRRAEALPRLRGLTGRPRLEAAARILSEQGFMAVVEDDGGSPRLRLCHCPLRDLVEVSTVPCRAEAGFVRELVGGGLSRVSYIPAGDAACAYEREPAR